MKNIAMMERGTLMIRGTLLTVIIVVALFAGTDVNAAPNKDEQRCLALSLYFEARGESRSGMIAVGWAILNRARDPGFPATLCGVVRQGGERPPCQFSWWCDGKSDRPRVQRSWNQARLIAAGLLTDPPPDPTGGAMYFHNASVRPSWAGSRTRTAQIGSHLFYR